MNVQYITNASLQSGVGHQAEEIVQRLEKMPDLNLTRWHIDGEQGQLLKDGKAQATITPWPGVLGSKSINWIRLGRALARQESGIKNKESGIFHITNQTLSFLAKKLSPSIVTVHDIIELLEPQDWKASPLNRYLYSGIKQASHIIAVSEYTKKTIQEHLDIPAEKITVIPNGVGPEFHPIAGFQETIGYQNLRQELRISPEAKVILYVGSDHPRKNVATALRALAKLKEDSATPLVLLKVGASGLPAGRAEVLAEIDQLNVADSVHFVDSVSVDRLNELYNLADVLVFPSRFEGFGLPPLQAMAAGTPVIAARSSSLPEVIGEAGLLHEPDNDQELAELLARVLTNTELGGDLYQRGLARAQHFSWEKAAEATADVYRTVVGIV